MTAIFLMIVILSFSLTLNANPLLNANVEDEELYEYMSARIEFNNVSASIQPLSYHNMLYSSPRYCNIICSGRGTGYYFYPLTSATFQYFYTDNPYAIIEGESGLKLQKGSNVIFMQEGVISLGEKIAAYYELKETCDEEDQLQAELNRGYIKFLLGPLSLEAGKDNVNIGPGEYGALLSKNAPPYPPC